MSLHPDTKHLKDIRDILRLLGPANARMRQLTRTNPRFTLLHIGGELDSVLNALEDYASSIEHQIEPRELLIFDETSVINKQAKS